jgi:hypothetical protein
MCRGLTFNFGREDTTKNNLIQKHPSIFALKRRKTLRITVCT